jgi:hypothetical protein
MRSGAASRHSVCRRTLSCSNARASNHGHGSDITLNAYVQLAPVKRLEAMQRVSNFIETRLMGLCSEGGAPVKALTWQGERVEGGLTA